MKASRIVALLVLAIAVSFGTAWQLASAQAEKAKPVQKWEYKSTNRQDELNEVAADGWELGWVTQSTINGNSPSVLFTWKRPKQ